MYLSINQSFVAAKERCLFVLVLISYLIFASIGFALSPAEIMVVANKNSQKGVGLANYYINKRSIPKDNLIQLWLSDKNWVTMDEYESKIEKVIRKQLKEKDPYQKIRCLVVMQGVPLKIRRPEMTEDQKKIVDNLNDERKILTESMENLEQGDTERKKTIKNKIDTIIIKIRNIAKSDFIASVDSELSLVLEEGYSKKGWIPNPYFVGFQNKTLPVKKKNILMVSRIDGPEDLIARRIIDDSIQVEKSGLKGIAYFDARLPAPPPKKMKRSMGGYGKYDIRLHNSAEIIKKSSTMPVVINDKSSLFQPGQCPEAALYCGWYSLNKYIDAFDWQPGAIGYHIASSSLWHNSMLKDGITATLGPVNEPYLQAFPIPEFFFGYLVEGNLTLVECYMLSLPYLSWQMVLYGDPLYRPFKNFVSKSENSIQ